MNRDCHDNVISEEFIEIIKRVEDSEIDNMAKKLGATCYNVVNDGFVVYYIDTTSKEDCLEKYNNSNINYVDLPILYGIDIIDRSQNISQGIVAAMEHQRTGLTGKGILIGLVDTGINYEHECFIYEDGTSKIYSLWDQSNKGTPPEGFIYGTEYTREDLNKALKAKDPQTVVPSKDENGHGTFLAGVAAGRASQTSRFVGLAPDAELVIVKLKTAKNCIKSFNELTEDIVAYQSSDAMLGAKYVLGVAEKLGKPVVLLFAGQSNLGAHDGTDYFEQLLDYYGSSYGTAITVTAGNEANGGHHFEGILASNEDALNVEINVGGGIQGFIMTVWNYIPDRIEVEMISPNGNSTGIFKIAQLKDQSLSLSADGTEVVVEYDTADTRSGDQVTFVQIKKPLQGIWTLRIHSLIAIRKRVDIWLPIKDFIDDNCFFLQPSPNDTIVIPGTTTGVITVGAHNSVQDSIFIPSGRGFTRNLDVKPDLVASGVNIVGPGLKNKQYTRGSGAGLATSVVAGGCAQMMEWGVLKKNYPNMNTIAMKAYLLRGARRKDNQQYPNREAGYGVLDIYNAIYRRTLRDSPEE